MCLIRNKQHEWSPNEWGSIDPKWMKGQGNVSVSDRLDLDTSDPNHQSTTTDLLTITIVLVIFNYCVLADSMNAINWTGVLTFANESRAV